ncbi:MAG TPA: YkgJ family cysteine cluster protein [Candidatus Sulfopaludibacter sp.]|nr:YkgJ family cysteine cluster protein [Candidatus Sulfopaludibacter sp.]
MGSDAVISPQTILSGCARMALDDRFSFRCAPGLDCFGQCCRDVSIVLTPYDVLRLKRALHLDSTTFLERHTLCPRGAGQKFPIVLLRMNEENRHCPFLAEKGCGVYADRPWACRMYPLGAAEPKAPTPKEKPFHFVIRENLCHGHAENAPVTVREWIASQGAEAYEMMSGGFKQLTLHDFWDGDRPLTEQEEAMFYMACYDLDRFRRFVFETRFLQLFEIDEARIEALRTDDEELLEFGMQWLRFAIFGERSMKMRRHAA